MYGSISGVKDNLPKFAEYIKPDELATDRLDIKETTVIQFLKEFSAVVENALSNRYVIPLVDSQGKTPEIIDLVVNNLASYKLANRFHATLSNDENHSISALRKDAKEILNSLVSGSYGLPGVAPAAAPMDELDLFLEERGDVYFDMEDPSTWQNKV
jgi:phage gp36-like protein